MIFSTGPKQFSTEIQENIMRFLVGQLPSAGDFYERLESVGNFRNGKEQEGFLRQLYFEVEAELVKTGNSRWMSPLVIRQKINQKWHLDRCEPDPFLLIFLSEDKQVFWIFAELVTRLLSQLNWDFVKASELFTEFGRDTFLAEVKLERGKILWEGAFAAFQQSRVLTPQKDLEEYFGRLVRRLYHELTLAFGGERARTMVEDLFRAMKKDYGFLDTLPVLLTVMPEGVLQAERFEFYPKKELQEELRTRMLELEATNIHLIDETQKLKKTIEELEEAKGKMQRMQEVQGDFIKVVSHQFRTPLSVIRWQAEIAGDFARNAQGVPQELPEALGAIHEKSIFLANVLNNVFDLLAIESGLFFLNKKPAAIWEILEDTRRDHLREAEQKHVMVVFEKSALPTEECEIDPEKFRRVIDTLVGNAIQYSKEQSTVTIGLQKIQEGEREAFYGFVRDEGMGIPSEEKERIFAKFFRGKEAVKTVPDGAGLGLYIAKHIIEAHEGRIWAESEGLGKGSVFHFTIPTT